MKLALLHQRRIVAALGTPKRSSRALRDVEHAIEHFRSDMDASSRLCAVELRGNVLHRRLKRYAAKGAPHKRALRDYIYRLIVIYERVTGFKITRNVDAMTGIEKRHPFIWACTRAAGASYSLAFVREVMRELRDEDT
jgi:hypothetical protein